MRKKLHIHITYCFRPLPCLFIGMRWNRLEIQIFEYISVTTQLPSFNESGSDILFLFSFVSRLCQTPEYVVAKHIRDFLPVNSMAEMTDACHDPLGSGC